MLFSSAKPIPKLYMREYQRIKQKGGLNMSNNFQTVPIHEKVTLTIKEAAEYSNIGINKIDAMLRSPNCPFYFLSAQRSL